MRLNLIHGAGLAVVMFLGNLAVNPTAAGAAAGNFDAKHSAHAQIVQALRSAHKLLAEANHDYQGHRVLAMHRIHMALKELGWAGCSSQPASRASRRSSRA